MNITKIQSFAFTLLSITFLASLLAFSTPVSAQVQCTKLSYTLTLGSLDSTTSGDVSRLQHFLKGLGYFSGTPTGYYGPVTRQAVVMWQNQQNFFEASGAGTIGQRSRSEILESCNAATIAQQSVTSKSNTFKLSGTAKDVNSVFVALVYPYTNEATDWSSVYRNGSYIAFTGDTVTKVKNEKWSVKFAGIKDGSYEARVYSNDDSSQRLLATQPLQVSAPDSFDFKAGKNKAITLGVGQTASDGGVTITLNDVFLTNGTSGSSRANFTIHADGYNPGSYSGGVGEYVPEGGGGIADEEAPYGSMRIKIKSISQSMNTVIFIVEGGKPKG